VRLAKRFLRACEVTAEQTNFAQHTKGIAFCIRRAHGQQLARAPNLGFGRREISLIAENLAAMKPTEPGRAETLVALHPPGELVGPLRRPMQVSTIQIRPDDAAENKSRHPWADAAGQRRRARFIQVNQTRANVARRKLHVPAINQPQRFHIGIANATAKRLRPSRIVESATKLAFEKSNAGFQPKVQPVLTRLALLAAQKRTGAPMPPFSDGQRATFNKHIGERDRCTRCADTISAFEVSSDSLFQRSDRGAGLTGAKRGMRPSFEIGAAQGFRRLCFLEKLQRLFPLPARRSRASARDAKIGRRRVGFTIDVANKTIAAARECLDRVGLTTRSQRGANEADRAHDRRIGDDHAGPQRREQFVFRDDAVAMAHEIHEQIERSRLQFQRPAGAAKFTRGFIQNEAAEPEGHGAVAQRAAIRLAR